MVKLANFVLNVFYHNLKDWGEKRRGATSYVRNLLAATPIGKGAIHMVQVEVEREERMNGWLVGNKTKVQF